MAQLDPVELFKRLYEDLPADLRKNVFVTGSLAAAYEFRVQLQGQAVNTKDADLLVHPAGDVKSAQEMALRLLQLGWKRTDKCFPQRRPQPVEDLRAIRLLPPASNDYFVEFLNVPEREQIKPKDWVPVELNDGYYGLPSFKFMGLTAHFRKCSAEGIEYAAPEMMALANLLSHPHVTDETIDSGDFIGKRRCAKDLGRILAIALLAGRERTEEWPKRWLQGMEISFPTSWRTYAGMAGSGLRELLGHSEALAEAQAMTNAGLLSGMNVDPDALAGVGQQILVDAVEPLENAAGS